jgi:hypothetical protein
MREGILDWEYIDERGGTGLQKKMEQNERLRSGLVNEKEENKREINGE